MKKIKGFSLMELVITLTIVVILSLISWPIYRSFHLREVSMLAEGYALLGAIKDAQIHYYNEYGNFLSGYNSWAKDYNGASDYTSSEPVFGINVMNNRYFSVFNYDSVHAPTWGEWKYRFIARVKGDLGKSGIVSLIYPFNLTERGNLTIIGNGTTTIDAWAH